MLSESAIWTNYQRTIDTESIFSEWAWAESMFFIWLNISSLYIFGLEPYEIAPLDPEFKVELPSLEEFLQGIKVKFTPQTVEEAYKEFNKDYFNREVPPVLDFDTFIDDTIKPEHTDKIKEQKTRKAIWGVSKYGESYVDPPVIRDFMRSTLYELAKRRMDFNRIRKLYQIAIDKGFIGKGIIESIYNRLVLHFQTIFESFILDYNLLNYSKLCERGSRKTTIPIMTWRGETFDAKITKFDEVNMGFILDVTPLNFGILMDRKSVFKPSPRSYPEKGTTIPSYFIDWKVRRMVSRYRATGVGFGNYQRPDEAYEFHRSERADHYHQIRLFYHHLDSLVDNFLEKEDVDVFKRNMYKRAVAMLVGHRKKRHNWGYDAFKSMSEDEFKAWWLEYWCRQGLDINILNRLYEMVKPCLQNLRSGLKELGRKLALKRKQLSQVYLA